MSEADYTPRKLLERLVELTRQIKELEADKKHLLQEQAAYRELKELFAVVLNQAKHGLIIVQDQVIVRVNPKFCELVGAKEEQIVGSVMGAYIPPDLIPEATWRYEERLQGNVPPRADRIKLVRADKRQIDVDIDVARVPYEGKSALFAVITDATYIVKAEQELIRLRQYQQSLVEQVNIWLHVLDRDGNIVIWNKAAEQISGYPKESVIGRTQVWELLFPDKAYRDEVFAGVLRIIRQSEIVQGIETTIVAANGRKKVISWYSRDLKDDQDQPIGSIALGLDVTELMESNEALIRSMEQQNHILEGTIQALGAMLEMRDPYTAGHQRRVTQLSMAIAERLGISGAQKDGLRMAALIHDIGKSSVPSEILTKPGRLQPAEFELLKAHPLTAYAALKNIDFAQPVAEYVLQHHERLDGSGYPYALKGAQVLREARILAVADVVEAMTSYRPYRTALGIDMALEEIKQGAGIRYDAEVAEACIDIFRTGGFQFDDKDALFGS